MHSQERSPIYTTVILSGPICGILGVSWNEVLDRAGIIEARGKGDAFLVSAEEYFCIWAAIMELSHQQDLPRLLGLRMASGPAIPVLFALSTAPDFETGIKRMAQFKHLFGPMKFVVSQSSTQFTVSVASVSTTIPLPKTLSSPQVIYMHAQAKALARHTLRPLRVCLPLPQNERERLADIFGQIPEYGDASLTYSYGDARVPFISNNSELWDATEADLGAQAKIQLSTVPLSDRVRATMQEAFTITTPTIAHICMRLRLSRSTLLRRLAYEGITYQSLLDATRKELAIRYLIKSDLNNQQIAHLVGYLDPNAFQRAFKKWTGETPQEFRIDHQDQDDV